MDLFAGNCGDDERFSFEVKQLAGFGKGGEKGFDGTVTGLQMQTYLCIRDFRQRINKRGESYGWPIAVYCTPEHLWGYEQVTKAYREEPVESAERIREHMAEVYPLVSARQLKKVLGI